MTSFQSNRPGPPGSGRRMSAGLLITVVVAACDIASADLALRFPEGDYDIPGSQILGEPIVGTNYTHRSFDGCAWDGDGILVTYHEPGVAEQVHAQLRQMRLDGIQSLRLIVWHMRDVTRHDWGVVPSRRGRLPDPYRRSLITYLDEVRRFGFARITISFSPQWANSPLRENYDGRRLEENWSFIEDVRDLALEHGPADVRFDLLNEGAPSDHLPAAQRAHMIAYIREMWDRYTGAFGADDVTVSVIAPERPRDLGRRIENLIDALEADQATLPSWFEVHLNYGPEGVAWGLHYVDSVLTERGHPQALTIGETSYDDPAAAAAIGAFQAESERPIREVVQWFKRADAACEVSPPYRADAYLGLSGASVEGHPLGPP